MKNPTPRAFTLIELLIVVAIIAILAALAVPNFLEAQTRSKVSRAKADMRTIATGLGAYFVDFNQFPNAVVIPPPQRLSRLTSPVAYLTTVPDDVFRNPGESFGPPFARTLNYRYGAMGVDKPSRYLLASIGPDRQVSTPEIEFYPGYSTDLFVGLNPNYVWTVYDPTNGTISYGDVIRPSDANVE